MKLSTQEEYGLRCLLQLASHPPGTSLSIAEISAAEGLSNPNVAKLLRLLRRGGFVESVRGQHGGYTLARPASEIRVGDVVNALGGRLYEPGFCAHHAGDAGDCGQPYANCSLRTLWDRLQQAVDEVLGPLTLHDLIHDGHYKHRTTTTPSLLQIESTTG